ncbi:SfiI family type II restriction endonuclease, partial [Nocardia sp. NPDC003354]
MHQDYRQLGLDEHELLEKQTLRMIVQALQQYSREAKEIFDVTEASSKSEVIVLAEDLTQYALEVAEVYAINKRFAGFIDYKRARWLPTPYGLLPQVLLVDAKASTENNRDTLQRSQLPMDAEFISSAGNAFSMS